MGKILKFFYWRSFNHDGIFNIKQINTYVFVKIYYFRSEE